MPPLSRTATNSNPKASNFVEVPVAGEMPFRRFAHKPTSENLMSKYWIQKETEVIDLDWNNLMVVPRCCAHD